MSNIDANTPDAAAPPAQGPQGLSRAAVAFGAAAAVAVLFNTLLAWVKDSVPLVNSTMARMTGHHWITHGIAVVAVFFVVGIALSLRRAKAIKGEFKPILVLFLSVVVAGLGLLGWFYFV